MPQKTSKNSFIVWKATIASVKVIEQGLAWHVGDGTQVRFRDPWVGCTKRFALTRELIELLNNRGLFTLNQIVDQESSSLWRQAWLKGDVLQLEERWLGEWENFISNLQNSNIRILDKRDGLRWVHSPSGIYSPKFDYNWLMSQKGWGESEWWFKSLWELKGPAKVGLFSWCILQNKVCI